ncbi:TetR/AcrR family transcriptional regulator [Streptomyces sp. NPDC003393]
MTPPSRTGRRPGDSGTREAILRTARRHFADLGHDRTTLRGIAADAGADVALVSHYFGPKRRLFAEAAPLPLEPEPLLAELLGGPRESIGHRLAARVLGQTETAEGQQKITGLIRAAASEELAARQIRERVTEALLLPLAEGIGSPDARLRAALAGSQIVGLMTARHIVGVEPLASSSSQTLAAAVGPVLQHYLTGPLSGPVTTA